MNNKKGTGENPDGVERILQEIREYQSGLDRGFNYGETKTMIHAIIQKTARRVTDDEIFEMIRQFLYTVLRTED